MAYNQRSKGASCVVISVKSSPDRGWSQCKGPEVELCLACLRNSQEAGVARAESTRGDEIREVMGTKL